MYFNQTKCVKFCFYALLHWHKKINWQILGTLFENHLLLKNCKYQHFHRKNPIHSLGLPPGPPLGWKITPPPRGKLGSSPSPEKISMPMYGSNTSRTLVITLLGDHEVNVKYIRRGEQRVRYSYEFFGTKYFLSLHCMSYSYIYFIFKVWSS